MDSLSKQKIVPHLWFDTQAKEAAEFYVDAFGGDSRVISTTILPDTPSGNAESVEFQLCGYRFAAISAGPYFKINPSISFFLNFDPSQDPKAREHLDALWKKLSEGGTALMPLGEYPFSSHYGWVQDKYGVSWQLILTNPKGEPRPFIVPSLLFVNGVAGKAEEALRFYTSAFNGAKQGTIARYPAGMEPDKEGTIMFSDFMIEEQWFAAMDSAHKHDFLFNEGISFIVKCENQEEIDAYTEKLSAVPEAEQCGWLKDIFGVSWQITPTIMDEMLASGTPEQIARVTQAFLPMKKFDIAALKKAFSGER